MANTCIARHLQQVCAKDVNAAQSPCALAWLLAMIARHTCIVQVTSSTSRLLATTGHPHAAPAAECLQLSTHVYTSTLAIAKHADNSSRASNDCDAEAVECVADRCTGSPLVTAHVQLHVHVAAAACCCRLHGEHRRSHTESRSQASPAQQLSASLLRCEPQMRTFAARRARNAKRHHSLPQTVHLCSVDSPCKRPMTQALTMRCASSGRRLAAYGP